MCHLNKYYFKKAVLLLGSLIFILRCISQCPPGETIRKNIAALLSDSLIKTNIKLKGLYELKGQADACKLPKDSLYANMLVDIGYCEYDVNRDNNRSIAFTLEAVHINSLPQKGSSKRNSISAYKNLHYYYSYLLQYDKSLSYCDSAIAIAEKFNDTPSIAEMKLTKAYSYFAAGDFQKCIEESTKGTVYALSIKDTANYLGFLVQRSQSYFFQNQIQEALADIDIVVNRAQLSYSGASVLKTKGMIYEQKKLLELAKTCYNQSVSLRTRFTNLDQITRDYIDLGNFYTVSVKDFAAARKNYQKAVDYASQDHSSANMAAIYTSLGNLCMEEKAYQKAGDYYLQSLKALNVFTGKNLLDNPTAELLNTIGNTDLLTDLLSKKVSLMLKFFKLTGDKKYLRAGINTALVTDSVITQKRHQQLGEQSKLYWRDKTRGFFTDAIEACFLANDASNAFYFMEKSRSVLLNDHLNELGASAVLSREDAQKEQQLKINNFVEQEKLNRLRENSVAFNNQEQVFLKAKEELEYFIRSLEIKYPAYYNYKYSDKIPALKDLQQHLLANNASFVHYFTTDTIAYILSITAAKATITRLDKSSFSFQQINSFLDDCANQEWLARESNYATFTALSFQLYNTLFRPLDLPKGRVIICSDNFLMPFEALCSDAGGKNFLISDYIFSYAYSATYLLKAERSSPSKGDFIGFAPVHFRKSLDVFPLRNSESALKRSAIFYGSSLLLTNATATKSNFLENLGAYTVANIFSHASGSNEPKLYMGDSVIYLSDLQLLHQPATQLVILSACQTNVGKHAAGEGIYSLARGFAAAGIPAVSATLWDANEDMIYKISIKFNEYLSQGMSKDSAIHQAKLDFIKNNEHTEYASPYHWANIILIGNGGPLKLSAPPFNKRWLIAGILISVIVILLIWIAQKREQRRQGSIRSIN